MIKTKEDLKYYIDCDLKSLGCYPLSLSNKIGAFIAPTNWKLQILLRKLEYDSNNCCNNIFCKLILKIKTKLFERYCRKLGADILPINVFGPGLCLNHTSGVVISGHSKIGSNARINANVNIGEFGRFDSLSTECFNAPTIGDNVYIGPGAKIFGKILIGNNVAIGANAVVNKDIPSGCTAVGVPFKIIPSKGSIGLIRYGDQKKQPLNK